MSDEVEGAENGEAGAAAPPPPPPAPERTVPAELYETRRVACFAGAEGGDVLAEDAVIALRAADIDPAKLERTLVWTISDAGRDRHNSRIMPKGGDFKEHADNPIVLWDHDPSQLPIATALTTYVEDSKRGPRVRSVAQFVPGELNPLASSIYGLAKIRALRGASIGFSPKRVIPDVEAPDDPSAYVVDKWSLLEWSVLNIPSNARALADAQRAGVPMAPVVQLVERELDGEQVLGWLRANAEAVWAALNASRPQNYDLAAFKAAVAAELTKGR